MDNNKILELIRGNREFTPRIMQDCASYKFFLKLCANNYRYSFSDQSMILMQKPNASNCASYEFWKENGRRVKKGAKGIALLRKGIFLSYIIYVFDRADTEGIRPNEIPLKQPSKAKIKNLITNMHFQYKHVLPELSEKISRLCFNTGEPYRFTAFLIARHRFSADFLSSADSRFSRADCLARMALILS